MDVVEDVVGQTLHWSEPTERTAGTSEMVVMVEACERPSTLGVAAIGPGVGGLLEHRAEVALVIGRQERRRDEAHLYARFFLSPLDACRPVLFLASASTRTVLVAAIRCVGRRLRSPFVTHSRCSDKVSSAAENPILS